MPYVKSISIRTTVNRSLAYILNPDKTDDLVYTTSLNCMSNATDAYLAMKTVYEHFTGEKYNAPPPLEGKGKVKAIHYIQSFDPKDNITPELAHKIAKAFARKTFRDNCQIVIATHLDKGHIHNHFILNTYGINGQKFNANKKTLGHIKEYSDRVCMAFGIQPYDKSKGKGKTIDYNEWEYRKRGTSWKQKIRLEIDGLIACCKNIDELLYELELKGYTVKRGKYISVKAEGQERFVRLKTLGEDYTEKSISSRILWKDVGANFTLDGEPSPMRITYTNAIGEISALATQGKKIQRKRDVTSPYTTQNDMDVYKLSAQLNIINRDNIKSIGELEGKIESLKEQYGNARQEFNTLTTKYDNLTSLKETAETYFELLENDKLSMPEQLRLKMLKPTLERNNIFNRDNYSYLLQMHKETAEKITVLKNSFEDCKNLYDCYSDIANTYRELSKGDYISRLVAEEHQKRERDEQQKKKKLV